MRLTVEELGRMRKWTRDHRATVIDERAREIEAWSKETFVELGLLCCEMDDNRLYENLLDEAGKPEFASFGQWLEVAMPTQQSTAYAALRSMRVLKDVVPESELEQIPRCNLETLGKCSTDVARDPLLVEKAKTMKQNEFVRAVQHDFPTQHLEERDPYRFAPTRSQREVIDAAISAVREDELKERVAQRNGQGHASVAVQ